MADQLSKLSPKNNLKKNRKRVGRGSGSGSGKYCGRGMKGQRSRSGGKKGLKLRGLRRNIRNFPKIGGFKSKFKRMNIVNLNDIVKIFKQGEVIGPKKMIEVDLVKKNGAGIKILANKKIDKKYIIQAHAFSKKAEEIIKKAGGKIKKI